MTKIVTVKGESTPKHIKRVPDVSDEQREKRLINRALELVEERMEKGEATSAEILHFLKLGSERNRREQEEISYRTELMREKTRAIKSAEEREKKYDTVIDAFSRYGSTILASQDEDYSDIFLQE